MIRFLQIFPYRPAIKRIPVSKFLNHSAIVLGTILLAACTEPRSETPSRFVDLSPAITEDLPVRMVGEKLLTDLGLRLTTNFESVVSTEPLYFFDSYPTLSNHVGTHVDAPIHLIENGIAAADYGLESFYGNAIVLDFSQRNPDDVISLEDVQAYDINAGDIVIFHVSYTPPESDQYPEFAVPSAQAAEYLATLPVKAYAVDSPSVDSLTGFFKLAEDGATEFAELLPVHHAFLSREIPIIEGLVNVEAIVQEESVVFSGFPLKMTGGAGDAGQLRAVALIY